AASPAASAEPLSRTVGRRPVPPAADELLTVDCSRGDGTICAGRSLADRIAPSGCELAAEFVARARSVAVRCHPRREGGRRGDAGLAPARWRHKTCARDLTRRGGACPFPAPDRNREALPNARASAPAVACPAPGEGNSPPFASPARGARRLTHAPPARRAPAA